MNLVKGILENINDIAWVISAMQSSMVDKKKFEVDFMLRICNSLAHNLAKLALSLNIQSFGWKKSLLKFLVSYNIYYAIQTSFSFKNKNCLLFLLL